MSGAATWGSIPSSGTNLKCDAHSASPSVQVDHEPWYSWIMLKGNQAMMMTPVEVDIEFRKRFNSNQRVEVITTDEGAIIGTIEGEGSSRDVTTSYGDLLEIVTGMSYPDRITTWTLLVNDGLKNVKLARLVHKLMVHLIMDCFEIINGESVVKSVKSVGA